MTYGVIGSPSSAAYGSNDHSYIDITGITTTAGSLVCVWIYYGSGATKTVSFSGLTNALSWNGETHIAGSSEYFACYYAYDCPANSSSTVRASFGANVGWPTIYWAEFSGIATTTPRLGFNGQFENANTTANALNSGLLGTLASQPAMLIGMATNLTGTVTPTAGTSPISFTSAYSTDAQIEHARLTATTSVEATFTQAENTSHVATAWAFAEAAAGGGGFTPRMSLLGVG
jgi:hypothetical protein